MSEHTDPSRQDLSILPWVLAIVGWIGAALWMAAPGVGVGTLLAAAGLDAVLLLGFVLLPAAPAGCPPEVGSAAVVFKAIGVLLGAVSVLWCLALVGSDTTEPTERAIDAGVAAGPLGAAIGLACGRVLHEWSSAMRREQAD